MTDDSNNRGEGAQNFSGRFPVRMPRYLHHQLSDIAREQGVSLNQFMCTAAAMAAGLCSEKLEHVSIRGSSGTSDEEYERIWRETFR